MLIYHGSTVPVPRPEIRPGNRLLDFGIGFYTTTSYEQADGWARIKIRRETADAGFVSVYDFDIDAARREMVVRSFDTADEEWLRFVVNNRRNIGIPDAADIHMGPVADDNVYQTVRLFETEILSADETVKRLKTEVLHDQIAFHTARALSYCRFIESRSVN